MRSINSAKLAAVYSEINWSADNMLIRGHFVLLFRAYPRGSGTMVTNDFCYLLSILKLNKTECYL